MEDFQALHWTILAFIETYDFFSNISDVYMEDFHFLHGGWILAFIETYGFFSKISDVYMADFHFLHGGDTVIHRNV